MRPLQLPVGTIEYVRSRVRVDKDATDPTSYLVEFALMGRDEMPGDTDWLTGDWAVEPGPQYFAQIVPNSAAEGVFRLWLRITTSDPLNEVVLRPVGLVEFVDYTGDAH